MVLIEVDVGKHVLEYGVDDVASLEDVVDPLRGLPGDDGLLGAGIAAVDFLRHGFVYTDGQDKFAGNLAFLDLVKQPGMLLEGSLLQLFGLEVVERQRDLLVLVVLIEVVQAEVCLLFGSHHALHELHGGIVLTTVVAALGLDRHLGELLAVGLELDVQTGLGLRTYLHDARLVAHGAEGDVPPLMAGYGVVTVDVGDNSHIMPLVHYTGKGYAVAGLCISDGTTDVLRLCRRNYQTGQYQ